MARSHAALVLAAALLLVGSCSAVKVDKCEPSSEGCYPSKGARRAAAGLRRIWRAAKLQVVRPPWWHQELAAPDLSPNWSSGRGPHIGAWSGMERRR